MNFNTPNVKNMEYMFYNNYNLFTLNLSSFQTDRVKNMSHMFENCYNLVSLDLSNFNSSIANIDNILTNTSKLEIIITKDENICNLKPEGSQCYEN